MLSRWLTVMVSPGRTACVTGAPTWSVKTAAGRDVTVDEREPDADFYRHLLLGVQVAGAVVGRTTDAVVSVRGLSINRPFSDRHGQGASSSGPVVR